MWSPAKVCDYSTLRFAFPSCSSYSPSPSDNSRDGSGRRWVSRRICTSAFCGSRAPCAVCEAGSSTRWPTSPPRSGTPTSHTSSERSGSSRHVRRLPCLRSFRGRSIFLARRFCRHRPIARSSVMRCRSAIAIPRTVEDCLWPSARSSNRAEYRVLERRWQLRAVTEGVIECDVSDPAQRRGRRERSVTGQSDDKQGKWPREHVSRVIRDGACAASEQIPAHRQVRDEEQGEEPRPTGVGDAHGPHGRDENGYRIRAEPSHRPDEIGIAEHFSSLQSDAVVCRPFVDAPMLTQVP